MAFCLILAGPTASGKSALALSIARVLAAQGRNAAIVNADSVQLYRDLPILTARPDTAACVHTPHYLYGILEKDETCSAGQWAERAAAVIREVWQDGALPVVAGGTGLYLEALTRGLAPIPDVSPETRARTRTAYEAMGRDAAYARLQAVDPDWAARIHPGNTQRLLRGLEVYAETGRPLSWWQTQPVEPVLPEVVFRTCVLDWLRAELYARCDARFDAMLESGALAEVQALVDEGYPADGPLMRVLGAKELAGHLRGERTRAEAAEAAKQATRRYAKRQCTWFRHRLPDAVPVDPRFPEAAAQVLADTGL